MTEQLAFAFIDDPPVTPTAVSRTTAYWRRRIRRAVACAFELGKRQTKRRAIPPPPRPSSAAVPSPLPPRLFYPSREQACELEVIAARLSRLTVSRTNPHEFFETRSELVFALRAIARRTETANHVNLANGR